MLKVEIKVTKKINRNKMKSEKNCEDQINGHLNLCSSNNTHKDIELSTSHSNADILDKSVPKRITSVVPRER